jgi:hypothetical protein
MVAAETRDTDNELRLRRVAPGAEQESRTGGQRRCGDETGNEAVAGPERCPGEIDDLVVVDVPGQGDDGVRRAVGRAPEVSNRVGG